MAKNAAKLVNATKIPELFPPVQFAFYGNTITRYRQKLLKKKVTHISNHKHRQTRNWT